MAALISGVVLLRFFDGLTFFYDEWNFIQDRRAWDADAFLERHNEHIAVVPALVFKVLFVTVGLESYWPYAVALVVTHLACAGVLFALLRAWSTNETAVLGTVAFLFMGTAWEVLLWPFEMSLTVSLGAALGAILALERRTRRGDLTACALLVVSVASASLGIPFMFGALILVLARGGGMGRLYVVAVPAALYGAWYLGYGESTAKDENIQQIPVFAIDSAAASLAGVFGMNPEIGRSLAIGGAALVVVAIVRRWSDRDRITVVVAVALSMWALLCLARFGIAPPSSPRYIYPGAALMLLLGGALLAGKKVASPGARVIALVLLALSLTTNIGVLKAGSERWRDSSGQVRAALGAMTDLREHVPDDFQPQTQYAPQVFAGKYFAAADDLGSPAFSLAEIAASHHQAKAVADDVYYRVGALDVKAAPPVPAGRRPREVFVANGNLSNGPEQGCVTAKPAGGADMLIVFPVPEAGLQLRGGSGPDAFPVGLKLARFADFIPGEPRVVVPVGGSTFRITPRLTRSAPRWRIEASSAGPITVCSAG